MKRTLTYASALAIAAGMTGAPVLAQSQDNTGEQMQSQTGSQATGSESGATGAEQAQANQQTASDDQQQQAQGQEADQATGTEQQQAQGQQTDQLIATVGDNEIRQSDVTATIETLPAGVQQTPPQMLLPAVVDQLITRRLIVDQARAEGLETDAEVQALVDESGNEAMEQALVEVWLTRQLGERVADEDVQAAVDELRAQNPDMGDQTPGLTQQVRQALQVQAMTDISDELRADADVTFYGPDGQPVDQTQQVGSGAEGENQTTGTQSQSQN